VSRHSRPEKNVLGLQITVDEIGLIEHCQSVEQLSSKHPDETCAEAAERVLLDQLVEVR
jgi:hypothetical protein